MGCYNTLCPGVLYVATDGASGDTTMTISGLTMTVVASLKMSSSETNYVKTVEVKLPTGLVSTTFTVPIKVKPCNLQGLTINNLTAEMG